MLLLVEVRVAGHSASLVMAAAGAQFGLLLVCWLEVGKARGWVRVFGVVYLGWLLVMAAFMLTEQATRLS
ncbi:hypothetical protein PMM47T1_19848 [Pseudomonas sp. M47T1]|nr:hypothetical protein PMM47T1_19848 [Pseudomonas sp. M47T1]